MLLKVRSQKSWTQQKINYHQVLSQAKAPPEMTGAIMMTTSTIVDVATTDENLPLLLSEITLGTTIWIGHAK
jgi:hypothetical protein